MKEEKRKAPKLRFPGLEGDWEERTFGNSFIFLQNNTLSRAELSSESGLAKNIHYGDVLIKFGEYMDTTETPLPYIISQQIVDKYKNSFLQDGDVIMADTTEDETVGKCTEIAGLQDFPTISGLHTIPLRPNDKFASGYLGYYLNSRAYHDQLLPLIQGIKVSSISKRAVQNTDISYPTDLAEQAAIGKYFIGIDTLITLHQQKLEQIKEYKKGMLQKMFPKKGETVPEVRFPGFEGDWEEKKVTELGKIYIGYQVESDYGGTLLPKQQYPAML